MQGSQLRSLLLIPSLLATLAAAPSAGAAPLPRHLLPARIASTLRTHALAGLATAVAVSDTETGTVLYRRNALRPLLPASNEKLYVTIAALTELGPDFRYETRVVEAGTRSGGVLHGNLFIVGAGDPTLSRFRITELARLIHAAGITRVTGRILGDETLFDRRRSGPGWPARFIDVECPPLSAIAIDRDVAIQGTFVRTPARRAARLLREALEQRSIKTGPVGVGKAPTTATPIAKTSSPPLWRILRFMNRESDNFTAEMVAKGVGAYAGAGGTTAEGMRVARGAIAPLLGDEAPRLTLADGSGLSLADRSTASALARLLTAASADPTIASAVFGSLSIAGRNGTLERRMLTLGGRVRGKTGTLEGVSSLTAYVTSTTGHRYVISIVMNRSSLSFRHAHSAQDEIASLVARLADN